MGDRPLTRTFSGRWAAVAILAALYAVSFIDRQILALLVDPVSRDLNLDRVAMGVLLGPGFALLYALIGLPMATWLDRGVRVRIVFVGVVCWSLATLSSAFVSDFTQLLVARAGVALGEAVLTPAAISIIGDLFGRSDRSAPTAVYNAMAAIMPMGSFVLGSAALSWATHLQSVVHLEPWRSTLVIVGLPGLVLSVFWLTVKEPARQRTPNEEEVSSFSEAVGYFRAHAGFYRPFLLAMSAICIVQAGATPWVPVLLTQRFSVTTVEAGYVLGVSGGLGGLLGAITWPLAVAFLQSREQLNGIFGLLIFCGFLIGVSAASLSVLPDLTWSYPTLFLFTFGISGVAVLPPVVLQAIAPSRLRARVIAFMLLANNIGGVALGPVLVAALSEVFAHESLPIAVAIAALAIVFAPIAAALWWLGRPSFSRAATGAGAGDRAT